MANRTDIAGIGRVYRGNEYLGEVLYKLNIAGGEIPGTRQISGNMLALQPALRFQKDERNALRLEDGQVYDITILFSDQTTGRYNICGDKAKSLI